MITRLIAFTSVCMGLWGSCAPVNAQVIPNPNGSGIGQVLPISKLPDAVPYELWNGMIVVKAMLGDGKPESAVLHTGLPFCVLVPEFAVKRSILSEGLRDLIVFDRTVKIAGAKPQTLRIDRLILANVPFGIVNLYNILSAKPMPETPPIWIGNAALAGLVVTIDPEKHQVVFRPPNSSPSGRAVRVPFEVKDGRLWVDVKINEKQSFKAVVDTGAVGTLLPAATARALALQPTTTITTVSQSGKEGKVGAVELPEITLGKLKITDVQALYVVEGDPDHFNPELGVIGNDVLLRYRVTIDYGRREIAFESLPPPKTVTATPPPPIDTAKKEKKP